MAKQTFTTGQVLTAAQMTSLQQTAMGGGSTTAKTTSYTLVAADAGTVVQMNSASATTITVNTALFAAGDTVQIQNIGAGVCTVTAGTATISTAGSLALSQYEGGQLYFNTTSAALFFDIVQGASGSMTSIASGSLPTGSGTLSLTSISGSYTHLQFHCIAWNGSGNNTIIARVNGDTGANYGYTTEGYTLSTIRTQGLVGQTSYAVTIDAAVSGNNKNITVMDFPFYTNATTGKIIQSNTGFLDSTSVRAMAANNGYYYGTNAAITQLDFIYGSNWAGGTYVLYGVN